MPEQETRAGNQSSKVELSASKNLSICLLAYILPQKGQPKSDTAYCITMTCLHASISLPGLDASISDVLNTVHWSNVQKVLWFVKYRKFDKLEGWSSLRHQKSHDLSKQSRAIRLKLLHLRSTLSFTHFCTAPLIDILFSQMAFSWIWTIGNLKEMTTLIASKIKEELLLAYSHHFWRSTAITFVACRLHIWLWCWSALSILASASSVGSSEGI